LGKKGNCEEKMRVIRRRWRDKAKGVKGRGIEPIADAKPREHTWRGGLIDKTNRVNKKETCVKEWIPEREENCWGKFLRTARGEGKFILEENGQKQREKTDNAQQLKTGKRAKLHNSGRTKDMTSQYIRCSFKKGF